MPFSEFTREEKIIFEGGYVKVRDQRISVLEEFKYSHLGGRASMIVKSGVDSKYSFKDNKEVIDANELKPGEIIDQT